MTERAASPLTTSPSALMIEVPIVLNSAAEQVRLTTALKEMSVLLKWLVPAPKKRYQIACSYMFSGHNHQSAKHTE